LSVEEVAIRARSEADSLSHQTLDIEHLLLALLHYDPRSAALLTQYGVNYEKAREIVLTRGIAGYSITLLGFPRFTFYQSRMK
jgi:ATP-dependent Clp protease ATP-binding subunit ClpA